MLYLSYYGPHCSTSRLAFETAYFYHHSLLRTWLYLTDSIWFYAITGLRELFFPWCFFNLNSCLLLSLMYFFVVQSLLIWPLPLVKSMREKVSSTLKNVLKKELCTSLDSWVMGVSTPGLIKCRYAYQFFKQYSDDWFTFSRYLLVSTHFKVNNKYSLRSTLCEPSRSTRVKQTKFWCEFEHRIPKLFEIICYLLNCFLK